MVRFIKEIRTELCPTKKVALFGDNASINKCLKVRAAAYEPDETMAECRLLYNQPYRPDLSKLPYFYFENSLFCRRDRGLLGLLQAAVQKEDLQPEGRPDYLQQFAGREGMRGGARHRKMQDNRDVRLETAHEGKTHSARGAQAAARSAGRYRAQRYQRRHQKQKAAAKYLRPDRCRRPRGETARDTHETVHQRIAGGIWL